MKQLFLSLLLLSLSLLGEELNPLAEAQVDLDLANPPEHLKDSALFQFLSSRSLTEVPYDPKTLIRQLQYDDYSPVRMYVPRGRSLQAGSTDENNPRIVIAPFSATKIPSRTPIGFDDHSAFSGTDYEGKLFFGISAKAKTTEVLSWNTTTGQFDFFVGNHVGKRVKMTEVVTREACLRCHQNGGPIFPPQPWSEAITHDPRKPPEKTQEQTYASDPSVYLAPDGVLLTRESTPFSNNTGLAIGLASSAGNLLLQANRIIRTVCRGDIECRRLILIAALYNPNQSNYLRKSVAAGPQPMTFDFGASMKALQAQIDQKQIPQFFDYFLRQLKRSWSPDNYAYINEFLPDLSQVTAGQLTFQQADASFPRDLVRGISPDVSLPYIIDVAFDALGLTLADSRKIKRIQPEDRFNRLQKTFGQDPKLDNLLTSWPPSRNNVMAYLFPEQNPNGFESFDNSGTVTAKTLFQNYCLGCHKANSSNPPIPFHDMTELKNYRGTKPGILMARLTAKDMPPQSDKIPQPTAIERKKMTDFLSGNASSVSLSHLGVRVLSSKNVRNSYIVPNPTVSIQSEFRSSCGSDYSNLSDGEPGLIFGRGSNGREYLALENFPHYFPGNIVQIFFETRFRSCTPIAVSRTGRLYRLGYLPRLGLYGTVPLTQSNSKVTLTSVASGRDMGTFGIGTDGKIYLVNYQSENGDTYTLTPLSVRGGQYLIWTSVTPITSEGSFVILVAQTLQGAMHVLTYNGQNEMFLEESREVNQETAGKRVTPNLTDRFSVLVVPGTFMPSRVIEE